MRSNSIDEMLGAQLFFKCENLQRTGAFKFGEPSMPGPAGRRPAQAGVITFSAGNHAQAIALAARLLDMPALVLMPDDAPHPRWPPRANTAPRC